MRAPHDQSQCGLTPSMKELNPRALKPASHETAIMVMTGARNAQAENDPLLKKAISWSQDIKLLGKILA